MISEELVVIETAPAPRLGQVLRHVGIASSSWYRPSSDEASRKRPGPQPKPIAEQVVQAVVTMATENPWYGYKRIAVMCRRADHAVKDREAYVVMRDHRLLRKPRERAAEVYQTARLFELLPQKPNDLWQMDVTYIHIPGHGWWYAVTVIDYYSRYLLACHLTFSYKPALDRSARMKMTDACAIARKAGTSSRSTEAKEIRSRETPCAAQADCTSSSPVVREKDKTRGGPLLY